jgi:hypothetical protein
LPLRVLQPHRSELASQRAKRLAVSRLLARARTPAFAGLRWEDLCNCPDWVCWSPERQQALAARVAAAWLIEPLRASIDGRALSAMQAVLGERDFNALRRLASDTGLAAALPDPAECATALPALGQRLLVWSLPSGMQAAVAAELAWPMPEQADGFDPHTVHAMWAVEQGLALLADATAQPEPSPEAQDA